MDLESVREYCLSLPRATEDIKWERELTFLIAGKIFAAVVLDPASPYRLSFKCTPEQFAERVEIEGIEPAPYTARYHWVALRRWDALPERELKDLIRESYRLVFERLPAKVKRRLAPTT